MASIIWRVFILLLIACCWVFNSSKLFWEFAEYAGAGIVTLGVVGEYLKEFKKFPKDDLAREKFAEWSVIVLIFGLVVELLGLVRTTQMSGVEIASLKTRAEEFRLKAVQLEMKMQPRKIYFDQRAKFMDLVKGVNKFPLKIVIGQTDNETENFAKDVSEFFETAGFHQNQDIIRLPNSFIRPMIPPGAGYFTHQMFAIYCSTNWEPHGKSAILISTNKMTIGFLNDESDPDNPIFQIVNKLNEAGIDADVMDGKMFLLNGKQIFQPGEAGIYVPQKIY